MSSPSPELAPDIAALLNVPDTFRYRGTEYRLRHLPMLAHAEFSRWLKDRAAREAMVCTAGWPPEDREVYLRIVSQDVNGGAYEFGGSAAARALVQPTAAAYALWLALKQDDPTIPLDVAADLVNGRLDELATALEAADIAGKLAKAVTGPPA